MIYQNVMVGAAGVALEKAADDPWAGFVEKKITKPLGMAATSFTTAAALQAADHASPHCRNRDGKVEPVAWYDFARPHPALSMNATARDLGKWLRFQVGDGTWNGQRLVSADSLAETHMPHVVIRHEGVARQENPFTQQISYALGWVVQDYRGQKLIQHAGNIDGMRAHITLAPGAGVGLAILANLQDTRMNLALSNHLVDHLLGFPYKDWDALYGEVLREQHEKNVRRAKEREQNRKIGTKPALALDDYVGLYENPAYGEARVVKDKDRLVWQWSCFRCPLEHWHFDTFNARSDVLADPEYALIESAQKAGFRTVRVEARVPAGLVADSAVRTVTIPRLNAVATVQFNVRGQLPAGTHAIDVVATADSQEYRQGYTTIDYEHISPRRLYRASRLAIEAVDLASTGPMRVGYIQGVGDNIAPVLEQLGVQVSMLDPAQLAGTDLRPFNAIVVGPRAYEAHPALVANNARLLAWGREGGTLVVQYGQYEMQQPGIMPYPVTINRPHDRVTMEDAPVTILDTTAAILQAPNRITARDFDGWVQDRSLYMPRAFDAAYTPLLAMSDPGEAPIRNFPLEKFGDADQLLMTIGGARLDGEKRIVEQPPHVVEILHGLRPLALVGDELGAQPEPRRVGAEIVGDAADERHARLEEIGKALA